MRVKNAEAQGEEHATASQDMHSMVEELEQMNHDATLRATDAAQEVVTLKRELATIKYAGCVTACHLEKQFAYLLNLLQ